MGFGVEFTEEVAETQEPTTTQEPENNGQEVQKQVEEKQQPTEQSTKQTTEQPTKEESTPVELNDDLVLDYFKKQGKEVQSLDDLFKPKEKIVEKNPYEDVLDDYDKKYLSFKRNTGLGRDEFDFVQQDFSKKSEIDLAIEKIKKDAGGGIDNLEVREYLEDKFGVDFETGEMSAKNKIELASFVKPYKEELQKLQEKYKATVPEKATPIKEEMVELEDGRKIPKSEYLAYKDFTDRRNSYLDNLKKSVSGATSFEVQTAFDNNGEKQPITFKYDRSEEDRHSMLSNASDLDGFVAKKFKSEQGFDYKGLAEFIDKAENFNKYVGLAMQQARAEAIEEMIANGNNENFTRKTFKPQVTEKGYGDLTQRKQSGFGVQI